MLNETYGCGFRDTVLKVETSRAGNLPTGGSVVVVASLPLISGLKLCRVGAAMAVRGLGVERIRCRIRSATARGFFFGLVWIRWDGDGGDVTIFLRIVLLRW